MSIFDTLIKRKQISLNKDEIAQLLKVSSAALEAFEKAYSEVPMQETDDLFSVNAQMAKAKNADKTSDTSLDTIKERIVEELISKTIKWSYDGENVTHTPMKLLSDNNYITNKELTDIPLDQKPMLAGNLMKCDLAGDTSSALLFNYQSYKNATNEKDRQMYYHLFRQGLDILDLDPITYEMLSMNPNSMGYWLPNIVDAVEKTFFKIPKTTIIKVPMSMLQLTRLEYTSLNRTTLDIVDEYCRRVFDLQPDGDYFVKTGTYSSKFDFRNAHVFGDEVHDLGEYLLFIQNQACMMAGPLVSPCRYGASTTNEWVVREFITDTENNGAIYHGLPLHTEYRVFVDFDSNEVLGISPYWEPEMMKKHFGQDLDNPDKIHDYISFSRMQDTMMERYNQNKDTIVEEIQKMLPNIRISGQWSVDIMQNGEDFWIIDMALANNSALNDCVKNKLKKVEENWLPIISV